MESSATYRMYYSKKGHQFCIGKNMANGFESHAIISWNDPTTGEWESAIGNEAGCYHLPINISPFVETIDTGDTIRFGASFELRYVGQPFIWSLRPIDVDEGKIKEWKRLHYTDMDV